MRRYIIAITLLLVVCVVFVLIPRTGTHKSMDSDGTNQHSYEYYYNEKEEEEDPLLPDDLSSILENKQTVPLDTNPNSVTVLVNRKYLLPPNYVPDALVAPNVKFSFSLFSDKRKMKKIAAEALQKLFNAAKKKGYELYGVSGYRSYTRQKQIYESNVKRRGIEQTDSVSAKPGSSEHQTGLAIDVSIKRINCRLDQAFGDTPEGKWLANNCHKFGYIIRYPKGKSDITGYTYEPWHIRYVGSLVASYLYKNKLTLEEYYGLTSLVTDGSDFASGVDVENADEVTYATPSPTPKMTNAPKSSDKPKDTGTSKPRTTKKPKKTPKPKKSSKPKKTPRPTPTAAPVKTEKPRTEETEKPPVTTQKPTPLVTPEEE